MISEIIDTFWRIIIRAALVVGFSAAVCLVLLIGVVVVIVRCLRR